MLNHFASAAGALEMKCMPPGNSAIWTPEEYALQAERFATAMRLTDSGIHFTAVGLETDPQWNWEVVKRLSVPKTRFQPGEWINALSAHYYPIGCSGGFENADYKSHIAGCLLS